MEEMTWLEKIREGMELIASGCDDNIIGDWYHGDCPSNKFYLSENGFLRCDN